MDEPSANGAPHHLSLSFEYDTVDRARIVERSVRVEVGEIDDSRSVARVEGPTTSTAAGDTERTVRVDIEADDLVALRAGTNTWIRLLDVTERVSQTATRHRDQP